MTEQRIARAMPQVDFTVDLEWTDGSRSVADFKPVIAVMADLGEVFGKLIDFADNLWRDTHKAKSAAE